MNLYLSLTVILGISAAFAYINYRYIKMPFVIGLFFLSTLVSLIILSSKIWFPQAFSSIKIIVEQTNISKFILEIMLGFLLFAGSLHTNWINIKHQLKLITLFAAIGVIFSTLLIAVLLYGVCTLFHLQLDFIYCLLFGALISPTDPIAVLGILTKANVPKRIETIIVGESLFNDGIGVVIFVVLLEALTSVTGHIDYSHAMMLFIREALGGIVFGLLAGFLLHYLLRSINHYETEVLLTLAFVMLGYSLCLHFHLSGALAMVVMGLLVGNFRQDEAMSDETQDYVHKFWELIDVILNAILFILIALVLVVVNFRIQYFIIGSISIVIVLLSRVIVVFVPALISRRLTMLSNKDAKLIVWGGLRGGLSIALVLSLPESEAKDVLLVLTYICVLFSILVQGLTIGKLAGSLSPEKDQ